MALETFTGMMIYARTVYTELTIACSSLIKMLYWMCDKSEGHPLSGKQLEHAIKRNFGGLESDTLNPVEVFKEAVDFGNSRHWYDFTKLPVEVSLILT